MNQGRNQTKLKGKSGRHLFEVLSQIKDSIQKNRFNMAWEMASKHYEQNRTSLTNQQIYHLCSHSCMAIERKVNHRMTIKNKRYVPPVTSAHLQHLLSLQLSLHKIILPELVRHDKDYFNLLNVETEGAEPKSISNDDLIFDRKQGQWFLMADAVQKQLKKMVKKHLKICNATLMYYVSQKRNRQFIVNVVGIIQNIFDNFKEHEFPSQVMDFQLIKLSIKDQMGINQGIKCNYKLPLAYLRRIYFYVKKKKEEKLDYCLKKFTSYLLLSFKLSNISIQDILVACCQAKFICKQLAHFFLEQAATPDTKKKVDFKRQPTIQECESQQTKKSRFYYKKADSQVTSSNIVEIDKLGSKKKIVKTKNQLQKYIFMAQKLIEQHISGRKDLNEIIQHYFPKFYVNNLSKGKQNDEYVESRVDIDGVKQRKGKIDRKQSMNNSRLRGKSLSKNNNNSLSSLLGESKGRSKTICVDENQQNVKIQFKSKQNGKFIVENIKKVGKKPFLKPQYHKILQNLLNRVESQKVRMIDEAQSDEQGNESNQFERKRKKRIQEFTQKMQLKLYNNKGIRQKQPHTINYSLDEQDHQRLNSSQAEEKNVHLLNDVVKNQVNKSLQLPSLHIQGSRKTHKSPSEKLKDLKYEIDVLNGQRKLYVDSLSMRKSDIDKCFKQNVGTEKIVNKKEKEQIDRMVNGYRNRIDTKIKKNKNVLKLQVRNGQSQSNKAFKKLMRDDSKGSKTELMNLQNIQEQFKRMYSQLNSQVDEKGLNLRCQFDKLRRDISKNQFSSLNDKKNKARKKSNCETIGEVTNDNEELC